MSLPRFHGIIPPMVTPLRGRDELDEAGLERLIERTCRQVARRIPVLVGITDTAFVESANLARWSANAGADAVVLAPPYYLPEAQVELQEYLDHLVPELPLPLMLYNMPALTKVPIELETVRRAMDNPRIIGIKDSSGSMIYLHRVLTLLPARPDWSVLVGPEEMLADAVLAGAHGGVNGGANIFPRLYSDLFTAALSGDLDRTRALHAKVMTVSESLYRIGRHPSAIIKAIKCALACLNLCDDFMAEPFHRFREPERELVRQALAALG